jgi:signal transduction histidine kinase/CheY-like chemotaxis protein
MSASDSPKTANESRADQEIDWREVLFGRVRIVIIAILFLAGVATFVGYRSDTMRVFGAALIAISMLAGVLLWSHWVSSRMRRAIAIALVGLVAAYAYLVAGYLSGPSLGLAFTLVLTVLLIGRKSFITLLIVCSLYLIALLLAVAAGVWQGPAFIDVDPSDPTNWYRTTQITILLWASLGFTISFVVNSIEENLARRRAALEQLQEEIAGRQAAEQGREEAETVAAEAQKLEAVGQLAAGIAHDFNNALLVIQGWNEIRGLQDSDDKQREATAAIDQAASRTTQLARQLLTFARKDLRLPKYLYLDRLAVESTTSLQSLVGARISLEIDVEPKQTVYADEAQMQQVLYNLVINSSHAIGEEGIIRVSVGRATANQLESLNLEPRGWVVLEVEDNGDGIDQEAQDHIFEPFFTTKDRGSGTGLGLSTVLGIVQQSGGHIDFSSRPGQTVFSIFLPSVDVSPPDLAEQDSVAGKSISGLRVLILEDDPLARQMLANILENQGCRVVSSGDGDDVLELLANESAPFDILCTDAIFPGANLERVLAAFGEHSPDGGVLVCSGYSDEDAAIEKVKAGDYAFLPKPFTSAQLTGKIRQLVHTN